MQMYVVGITDSGTLGRSTLTLQILNAIRSPRVAASVTADPGMSRFCDPVFRVSLPRSYY